MNLWESPPLVSEENAGFRLQYSVCRLRATQSQRWLLVHFRFNSEKCSLLHLASSCSMRSISVSPNSSADSFPLTSLSGCLVPKSNYTRNRKAQKGYSRCSQRTGTIWQNQQRFPCGRIELILLGPQNPFEEDFIFLSLKEAELTQRNVVI